jgi:hypothetical protein
MLRPTAAPTRQPLQSCVRVRPTTATAGSKGFKFAGRTSQCPADQRRCGGVAITLSHLDLAVKDGSGRQVDTCSTGRRPVGWKVKVV